MWDGSIMGGLESSHQLPATVAVLVETEFLRKNMQQPLQQPMQATIATARKPSAKMRASLGLMIYYLAMKTACTTVRAKAVLRATEMKMWITRANAKPSVALGTATFGNTSKWVAQANGRVVRSLQAGGRSVKRRGDTKQAGWVGL